MEMGPPPAGQADAAAADDALSVRAAAEWMDHEHTPRRLRGNGPPFADRPDLPPFDKMMYERKPTIFYPGRFGNVSYDLGMAYRTDDEKIDQQLTEKGLVESHRWSEGEEWRSLRNTLERHREGTRLRILWLNTRLIKWGTDNRGVRAREIGRLVDRDDYDVVAMCEVFDPKHKDALTDAMGACDWTFDEPYDVVSRLSSRLLTMAGCDDAWDIDDRTIDTYDAQVWDNPFRHAYQRHTITIDDGDVDRGFELFSTHLQPNQKFLGDDPGDDDDADKGFTGAVNRQGQKRKIEQLEDLVASVEYRQNFRGDLPKIVVGDLNFGSDDDYGTTNISDIDHLIRNFRGIDLQDAWMTHGGPAGGTIGNDVVGPDGDCKAGPDGKCPAYVEEGTYPGGTEVPRAMCYSQEFFPESTDEEVYRQNRLDYVFVEEPKPHHAVSLDISRMWRLPFALSCPGVSGSPYKEGKEDERLVDHAGIGFELLVTPSGSGGWFELAARSEGTSLDGRTLTNAVAVANRGEAVAPDVSLDVWLQISGLYSPFEQKGPVVREWSDVSLGRIGAGKTERTEIQASLPEEYGVDKEGETANVRLQYYLNVDGEQVVRDSDNDEVTF